MEEEEAQVQVSLAAQEAQQDRWVQRALGAPPTLQVLLLLWALVALVVLAALAVHPYQEVLERQDHLFHQGFQDDLQVLSTLWPQEDPEVQLHPLVQSCLVVQQNLSLL